MPAGAGVGGHSDNEAMETRFVEAHQGDGWSNWGKFAVSRFTPQELAYPSRMPGTPGWGLVRSQGWSGDHVQVFDLATGEGAMFRLGGLAPADLEKHQVWVCVLFEAFLDWLYRHYRADQAGWWDTLPAVVELPGVPFAFHGHRRPGPPESVRVRLHRRPGRRPRTLRRRRPQQPTPVV